MFQIIAYNIINHQNSSIIKKIGIHILKCSRKSQEIQRPEIISEYLTIKKYSTNSCVSISISMK